MILRNSGVCPHCKQEIVSRYRHDFVECKCKKSFVDGGTNYLRHSIDLEDTSLDTFDDISVIRKGFEWGNRGKDGKSKLSYKKLKDMSTSHIHNILMYIDGLSKELTKVFVNELEYRKND